MGTILTGCGDAAYGHEGYPAQVLKDGSITGTYSDQTTPRMVGQLVAACGCGWAGTTRYPTRELLDTDAEGLALAEWEQSHARPVLQRLQLDTADQLGAVLCGLAREHAARLAPESMAALAPAARLDVVDQALAGLGRASQLAQQLHQSLHSVVDAHSVHDDRGQSR